MSAPLLAPLVETLARFLRTRDSGAGELSVLVTGGLPAEDPRVLFTLAPRLVGKGPAPFAPDDLARVPWPVATLAIDELVRVVVLARAGEILNFDAYHALVEACYRQGEVREKVAVLRALPFLEGGASFVDIAQDACRSHVQPVFDAIFTEVPIARIVGLAGHHDSELARMASAYIDERRAAGRSVPEDALFLVNKGTP
jgi:hypothetical protein